MDAYSKQIVEDAFELPVRPDMEVKIQVKRSQRHHTEMKYIRSELNWHWDHRQQQRKQRCF